MKKEIKICLILFLLFGSVQAKNPTMTVRKPVSNFTVELEKMNVMYMGVDNPIQIGYNNLSKTYVKITDGFIRQTSEKGRYIVRVTKGNVATLGLYTRVGNKEQLIGERLIRVKKLPDPVATVAGVKEGLIKKSMLAASPFILAKFENFDFDLPIRVYSFTVTINVAGEFKSISYFGSMFSLEQLLIIDRLKNNGKIIIEDIKCKLPDGTTRLLAPIILKIST